MFKTFLKGASVILLIAILATLVALGLHFIQCHFGMKYILWAIGTLVFILLSLIMGSSFDKE